jgi:hypothetical protein
MGRVQRSFPCARFLSNGRPAFPAAVCVLLKIGVASVHSDGLGFDVLLDRMELGAIRGKQYCQGVRVAISVSA